MSGGNSCGMARVSLKKDDVKGQEQTVMVEVGLMIFLVILAAICTNEVVIERALHLVGHN